MTIHLSEKAGKRLLQSVLLPVLLLWGLGGCTVDHSDPHITARLDSLYDGDQYFKMNALFQARHEALSAKDKSYYSALLDNAFYRPETSNRTIERVLREYGEGLSGIQMMNLHRARFMNYYNLFEYEEALSVCSLLIARYQPLMDSATYAHLFNDRRILEVLRHESPQRITRSADSRVPLIRDKMGLLNISLTLDGQTIDFLFDTGSSFSFIRRSIAEAADYTIYDVNYQVEGATGASVYCDVTVAEQLKIGNVLIENAVLWVFDDSDVTLPEYDYAVNGAIAFPILRAMEEIQIQFNDTLFIPETPREYALGNLAITDLDPVIAVLIEGDTLPFFYDTGAAFSSFYKPYYDIHATRIDTTYEQKPFNIGSLGGVRDFECYIIDSMELEIAGSRATIHDIEAHTEPIYRDPEKVFGNLGQDFFLQFNKMVISTRHASVFLQ